MSDTEDQVPEVSNTTPVTLQPVGRIGRDVPRDEVIQRLAAAASAIRQQDISMVHQAGLGHVGGEFSVIDILTTLYVYVMNVDPTRPGAPDRDRFILSKGHAAAALYTTLAAVGLLPVEDLATFMQPESRLNGHPARTKVEAVEASTGPLGHGLPIAAGTALAGKLDGSNRRTFVVLGDGEMQEGSNWEAIMFAAHQKLSNLVAVVDRNRLQQGARVVDTNDLEPLGEKFASFGWNVIEVNGHDYGQLIDAFADVPSTTGRPTAIIAHTVKGHPVSFISDQVAWHHKVPSTDQLNAALAELGAS